MSTEAQFRQIALSLPETSEKVAWDMPTFRVRGKIFASLSPDHGPGIKITRLERAGLAGAEPAKFFWTSHDDKFDFMRLRLAEIDEEELRELLTEAWRFVAGPRMAARHSL